MSTPRTAAVVGAGLAGTTAALGLVDAGFAVTLYSDRDRDALRNDVPATAPPSTSASPARPTPASSRTSTPTVRTRPG